MRTTDRIGQILFCDSLSTVDPVLLEAYAKLMESECSLDCILPLCTNAEWNISTRISEAASMRFVREDRWLRKIHPAYEEYSEIKTPNAFLGIFLGIMKAANWYDNAWRPKIEFCETLPNVIYWFIVCQSNAATTTVNVITSKYESLLSDNLKNYARSSKEVGQKSARLVQISYILRRLREEFDSKRITLETISPLGVLILDQILYALFGDVSMEGRMQAMSYLMNEHIDRIVEQVKTRAGAKTN
ncbi:MAG: hypothetical protein AAB501_01435 [Patescibacteria group bacterium]